MSHFCVMVIGENPEEQLYPFNEQPEEGSELLTFQDKTEEVQEEWENGTTERIQLADGSTHYPWDRRFDVPRGDNPLISDKVYPEDSEKIDLPYKEIYSCIEEFVEKYFAYSTEFDDVTGPRYGYYSNENAKWDWYVLGGRWKGYFKIKPMALLEPDPTLMNDLGFTSQEFRNLVELYQKDEKKFETTIAKYSGKTLAIHQAVTEYLEPVLPLNAKQGESGVFGNDARGDLWVDQCMKGSIDLDGMYEQYIKEGLADFDAFYAAIDGIDDPGPWDKFREAYDDIELAREAWHATPWQKAIAEAKVGAGFMSDNHQHFRVGDPHARENFIEDCKCRAITPFAFLKDGDWVERGQMGWWACVSDEEDTYDWSAKFRAMFEELPDDTLISMYDCHI